MPALAALNKSEGGVLLAEPVAAVGEPPTQDKDGNCERHAPPKWKQDVGEQSKADESDPEDFALHGNSLARLAWLRANRW